MLFYIHGPEPLYPRLDLISPCKQIKDRYDLHLDGNIPRKTQVLQEVIWVIQQVVIFPLSQFWTNYPAWGKGAAVLCDDLSQNFSVVYNFSQFNETFFLNANLFCLPGKILCKLYLVPFLILSITNKNYKTCQFKEFQL